MSSDPVAPPHRAAAGRIRAGGAGRHRLGGSAWAEGSGVEGSIDDSRVDDSGTDDSGTESARTDPALPAVRAAVRPPPAGPGPRHPHTHAHGPGRPTGRRVRLLIAALLVPCALATLVGVVAAVAYGRPRHRHDRGAGPGARRGHVDPRLGLRAPVRATGAAWPSSS